MHQIKTLYCDLFICLICLPQFLTCWHSTGCLCMGAGTFLSDTASSQQATMPHLLAAGIDLIGSKVPDHFILLVLHLSFIFPSLSSFLAEETENHSVSFCFVLGSWRAGRETWMVSPVLCIQSCTPSSTSHVIAKNTPLHWNQDGNMDPPALSNTSICKHTGSYRPF